MAFKINYISIQFHWNLILNLELSILFELSFKFFEPDLIPNTFTNRVMAAYKDWTD